MKADGGTKISDGEFHITSPAKFIDLHPPLSLQNQLSHLCNEQ